MKVLFICYANVGRSQVAEACFRSQSRHDCTSAGIAVDERIAQMKLPGEKLKHTAVQHSVEYSGDRCCYQNHEYEIVEPVKD